MVTSSHGFVARDDRDEVARSLHSGWGVEGAASVGHSNRTLRRDRLRAMKNARNWAYTHRGFTLIELMVAVAIIGILAAIAVGLFRQYAMRAIQSEAKELLSSIYTAESAYYSEKNSYDLPSVAGFSPSNTPRYYKDVGDSNFVFTTETFAAWCSTNLDNDAVMDVWQITNQSRQPVNSPNDIIQ